MLKKSAVNFDWKYCPKFEERYIHPSYDDTLFETVNIPHTNIEVPYHNFDEKIYQFESCYRKKIWIEPLKEDEQVFIKFNAVMAYAKVYLNGKYLGEHRGGYTPFKLDLTPAAIFGDYNILVIYVDSRERKDIPPFGHVIDYLTYGGIYREVSLEYCYHTRVDNVCIKTSNVLTDKSELFIDLYMYDKKEEMQTLTCEFKLLFRDECIKTFEKNVILNGNIQEKITVKEVVKHIELWQIDDPNLYDLDISLFKESKVIDRHRIRFGFRQSEFKPDGYYLNGKKIKLQGLNRHQSFPYAGYAMPKSAQYKDAEILKYDLGVNMVRLSHYPQSDHFMDRCDEIGLLIFDEIPGWQYIGDEAWQNTALQHVEEMILKDFNHPSVIIWGVRINESQDHDELYEKTNRLARQLDDSRPTGGVRCIKKSHLLEDVYTYNDFVHRGNNLALEPKRKVTKTNKPYLITEYNGHMFPTKKFDDEAHRVEHGMRHLMVMNAMRKDDQILGAIGWCMFDYNTHKDFGSGDRICYHGVLDMFRIPKDAAYAYGSQQDNKPVMHVASTVCIGEHAGSLLNDIHIYTNCDYVKLFKNDLYVNTFYPREDLYPYIDHPTVIIDDFIGNAIKENEKFTERDAGTIKALLHKVNQTGGDLSVIDKIKLGWLFIKYKMNILDAEDLYTKYFGGWGDEATNYRFEGYLNNTCVATVHKSQVFHPSLKVMVDEKVLVEEETYDTTRIVLSLVDDYDNPIIYAHDSVIIETEGPIKVIGPKVISLIGGSRGFWIKSVGKAGKGKIIIKSERFGEREEIITVIK